MRDVDADLALHAVRLPRGDVAVGRARVDEAVVVAVVPHVLAAAEARHVAEHLQDGPQRRSCARRGSHPADAASRSREARAAAERPACAGRTSRSCTGAWVRSILGGRRRARRPMSGGAWRPRCRYPRGRRGPRRRGSSAATSTGCKRTAVYWPYLSAIHFTAPGALGYSSIESR